MRHDDDHEPVFIRSKWGTNGYVYNHRNPVGRTLIVLSLLVAGAGLLMMPGRPSFGEGDLRDAVHEATDALAARPHTLSEYGSPAQQIADLIEEAVDDADDSWLPGPDVTVEPMGKHGPYQITASGTDTAFCMNVARSAVDAGDGSGSDGDMYAAEYDLIPSLREGRC